MTWKSLMVSVLFAFVALVVLSLVRGAPYLETPLPGGLPLGNGLVAMGLCAMAGAAGCQHVGPALRAPLLFRWSGRRSGFRINRLAGNPQLNFNGGRGSVWLALCVVVVAGACSTLLWALGAAALAKFWRSDPA